MTRLYFVTPAWQRYELTALCLEQRCAVIAALAAHGIEAHQVVIADDENLDIARALGAHVVEAPNIDEQGRRRVGGKFNDGNAYASEQGADWIVQIGSDSWVDPAYFAPLVEPGVVLTSPAYAAVTRDRLAELRVAPGHLEHSAGPYVFHRSWLEPSGFRPSSPWSSSTDRSTIGGIEATTGRKVAWLSRTVHAFQYVGFRVAPMMTSYESLARWRVAEHDPWPLLARYYPPELVRRAQIVMQREVS